MSDSDRDVTSTIEALLSERREFPPPEQFMQRALVASPSVYKEAENYEEFWARQAESFAWRRPHRQTLDWSKPPFARWFVDGKLNITENCLDRHLQSAGDKVAYYWEGEPGDRRTITYAELHAETCRLANALADLGVRKGDRVAIYMGMVPELPVALLACARLGAPHSVVFGGFSSEALRDRIQDAECKALITCDGSWRNGAAFPLKEYADAAVADCPSIETVVVLQRTRQDVVMTEGRDVWWHDAVAGQPDSREAEEMDSEDMLYILYTSGTTAKPKGIVHTTAGYMVGTAVTHRLIFDIHPEDDVYWCAADVGWVTGHSYIVYAPLCNGCTSVLYEGVPNY
ncbi:MAG TPA: AMP-binding protein, partial [Acidimicrobiales bacterium]|nr:AMP-binding protein [Acidimicrobiales bacterium]